MKKNDIIAKLAEKRGTTKKEAGEFVDAFIEIVKDGIKEDGAVDFTGFVKISKEKKAATTSKNPRTGEVVNVPEKYTVKAKFSNVFKTELNV